MLRRNELEVRACDLYDHQAKATPRDRRGCRLPVRNVDVGLPLDRDCCADDRKRAAFSRNSSAATAPDPRHREGSRMDLFANASPWGCTIPSAARISGGTSTRPMGEVHSRRVSSPRPRSPCPDRRQRGQHDCKDDKRQRRVRAEHEANNPERICQLKSKPDNARCGALEFLDRPKHDANESSFEGCTQMLSPSNTACRGGPIPPNHFRQCLACLRRGWRR